MAAIEIKKGTYRWNDTITNLPTTSVYILDFESNLDGDAKYTFNKLQSSSTHIQFYVASVNDETTNSAVGTFIDVYNLSSNLWQWSVQEFTVTVATTVDSEFGTWFNSNATAISVEDTPEYGELKVYSNDGTTLLKTISIPVGETVTFTANSNGFSGGDYSYTYNGDKTFLGIATNANATTPAYAVGSTVSWTSTTAGMTVYIVEEITESEEPDTPTETKTIKAGTYRFNDVLTDSENHWGDIDINFTLPSSINFNEETNTVTLNATPFLCYKITRISSDNTLALYFNGSIVVYIGEAPYYWNTVYEQCISGGFTVDDTVKGYGQIITITEDFTSADEYDEVFVTWFNENAKPYTIPTEDSIIAKMKALIAKANITTGKSDTDLTEAILSLAAGYGVAGEGIVEVTSEATMTAILNSATTANSGKLYKYVGPGGTYCLGALSGSSTISAVPGVDMNYGFSSGAKSIEFVSVDDAGTVTKPSSLAVNTAYKMRLYRDDADDATSYFNGSVTDGVLQTTTTPVEGANVYLEGVYDTDGSTIIGYRFYFMNGTDDTYIDVTTEGEIAFVIENPNAVYKQKTSPACWYTTVGTYTKNAYYRLEVK